MNAVLRDVTLEQLVKRFVSEDVHIRVSSFGYVTSYYNANIVYDGEAAPICRDELDPNLANLIVLGVDSELNGILYIYCE